MKPLSVSVSQDPYKVLLLWLFFLHIDPYRDPYGLVGNPPGSFRPMAHPLVRSGNNP